MNKYDLHIVQVSQLPIYWIEYWHPIGDIHNLKIILN